MEKVELDQEKLIKLVKKHKRLFEHYFIKRVAYMVNGSPFYLASYQRGEKTTGYAVLSPVSSNSEEHMKALIPLLHYAVAIRNISTDGKYRADVNFRILYEVRDYLKRVLEAKVLGYEDEIIYQRSLKIIQTMLDKQEELVIKYREAIEKNHRDTEKGFVTDSDVNKMKSYIVILMRLQYKQFVDRYDYREDFDVIYKNSNYKEIKQFDEFSDPNTLREMTAERRGNDLRNALAKVSYGRDLRDKTGNEYDRLLWMNLTKN